MLRAMPYQKETSHLLAADGTRIAFHAHGPSGSRRDQRPAVVLTNGIGTTENFWRFLVDALQRDFRLFHWDYRGHGESEVARSKDYRLSTQADDLARVTARVQAGGTAPVLHVAFSMGVAVLLEHYRAHPGQVQAMALIAGGAEAPGTGTPLFRLPYALPALRWALGSVTPALPYVGPWIQRLMRSPLVYPLGRATGVLRPRAPRKDIDAFMDGLSRMDPTAYWATLRALFDADASDVLPTVRVPTLVIAATKDLLMPRTQVEALRRALPHAEYLEVEDAGHAGLLEAGTEMAAAVKGFFSREARVR